MPLARLKTVAAGRLDLRDRRTDRAARAGTERERERKDRERRDATGSRRGDTHHRLEQPLDRGRRLLQLTRVRGGGLDDRAPRRREPVEAFPHGELADRPGRVAAGADQRDRREVRADRRQVGRRIERQDAALVELDPRLKEGAGRGARR